MHQRIESRRRERRHLIWLIALILPLYIGAGRWGADGNTDVISASVTSWQIVNQGTLDVSEYQVIQENLHQLDRWFVELPDGRVVSNRPPGLILLAIPAYAVSGLQNFTLGPGTVVALLATILAVIITWQVLIGLIGLNKATGSAFALAFGTTTWWISAAQLWPHGPNQLWAALALIALSASSHLGAGWTFAASITMRPVTAVYAAITGLWEGQRLRSWAPILKIGLPSALGAGAVIAYNRLVFGGWSIKGGFSPRFTSGGFGESPEEGFSLGSYAENVFEMFLGFPNGFLIMSPILGIAAIGAILARRAVPRWAISTAMAGLGYLLVHAALNRASGGLGIFYRYPLEAIVLAAPALAIGGGQLWDSGPLGRRLVGAALAISILAQALYVTYLSCFFDAAIPMCVTHWM